MNNQSNDDGDPAGSGDQRSTDSPQNRVSVLIVDDHAMLAGGLAAVLTAMDCTARTLKDTNPNRLHQELQNSSFDLVLVRIQPGPRLSESLELVRTAAKQGARVAVISETTQELVLAAAVENGAVALLSTTAPIAETVQDVIELARGHGAVTDEQRTELADLLRQHQSGRELRFMPFETLSRRESEVLQYLMEGMSVAKIAENSFVSVGTVRTQVKAILRKLGVSSQVAAVALAYRSGWPETNTDLPVDLRLQRPAEHGQVEDA